MPRKPRERAASGYYHVTVRGNGQQTLFEDDSDREAFVAMARDAFGKTSARVVAWCLMGNHAHLLIDDSEDELSQAMGSLCGRFAMRYNHRNGHVGHVFQGRFGSVPIIDDAQLLAAIRYVHDNPVRAGMCTGPGEYRWSSYHEYAGEPGPVLSDTTVVLDMLGGPEGFMSFMAQSNPGNYRPSLGHRPTDEEAARFARELLDGVSPAEVMGFDKARRDEALRILHDAGLSLRQIQRMTGIGMFIINKAVNGDRPL